MLNYETRCATKEIENAIKLEMYHLSYRTLHHDEILERKRKWRMENPDVEKERSHSIERKIWRRAWYKANKDRINEQNNTWKRAHPEIARAKGYKRKYGITIDYYEKLFKIQEGKCAICGMRQADMKIWLCVDHNHITGEVRGLLCQPCNALLGMCDDDIDRLKKAIDYLRNYDG